MPNVITGSEQVTPEWLTGVLRCFDAEFDASSSSYHLLLEDLSGSHTSHPPSMLPPSEDQCLQIVDALAEVHAFWGEHSRLGDDIGNLQTENQLRAEMSQNENNFSAFADYLGDRLPGERRWIFEGLLAGFLPVQRKRLLQGKHQSVIHDDPIPAISFTYVTQRRTGCASWIGKAGRSLRGPAIWRI